MFVIGAWCHLGLSCFQSSYVVSSFNLEDLCEGTVAVSATADIWCMASDIEMSGTLREIRRPVNDSWERGTPVIELLVSEKTRTTRTRAVAQKHSAGPFF